MIDMCIRETGKTLIKEKNHRTQNSSEKIIAVHTQQNEHHINSGQVSGEKNQYWSR